MIIALLVGLEVQALLIGQSMEPEKKAQLLDFLQKREEIARVFNLLTLQLGNDVMVAVKAEMAPMESPEALIKAINRCEVDLKKAFPSVLWLFFEPDHRD